MNATFPKLTADTAVMLAAVNAPVEQRRVAKYGLTFSAGAPNKTDLIDETDNAVAPILVSNEDFLRAIFGELEGESRPIVCGFGGDPRKSSGKKWFGRPWV